jgi:hypothetical protein
MRLAPTQQESIMSGTSLSEDTTQLLRHLVATIAYRSSCVLGETPEGYANASIAEGGWTAHQLVHHMTNVLAYCHAKLTNTERVGYEPAETFEGEVERFYEILGKIDGALASGVTLENPGDIYRLLQGPLVDACTHIGQLAALRRALGSPVPPRNYIKAKVEIGRTGMDQNFG